MHGCGFVWIHGRIHKEYLTGVIDHAHTLPATRRQAQVFWRLDLITVKHAGDELEGVFRAPATVGRSQFQDRPCAAAVGDDKLHCVVTLRQHSG